MKVNIIFIILVMILSLPLYASLEISVSTNKEVYQLGEYVDISISVFNSGSTSEILYGGFYFTTYIMDGIYDWANRFAPAVLLQVTFLPGETKIWEMSHAFYEMQAYPLEIGTHSIVGGAGNLQSMPIEFQVVPEPTSVMLFGIGLVFSGKILSRKRRGIKK